jgi:hypothetical protein
MDYADYDFDTIRKHIIGQIVFTTPFENVICHAITPHQVV